MSNYLHSFIGFDFTAFRSMISARYSSEAVQRIDDFVLFVEDAFSKKNDRFVSHKEFNNLIDTRKTLFNLSFQGNKNRQLKQIFDDCFNETQKNSFVDFEKLNINLDKLSVADDEYIVAVNTLTNKLEQFITQNRRLPTNFEFTAQSLKISATDFNNPKFQGVREAVFNSLKTQTEVQELLKTTYPVNNTSTATSSIPTSPSSPSSTTPSQSSTNVSSTSSTTPSDQNPILINQQNIGECAFLSAFQSISQSLLGRQRLRDAVTEKENEYQVKVFNEKGEPEFVTVTKDELRGFSVGNQTKETYPANLTKKDGTVIQVNITKSEYERYLNDKEYSKVEVDFNKPPILEPLKEASCSTSINEICSLMDILRLAYVKSSAFRELNGLAKEADLGTLLRKFNNGNYSNIVMKVLTGWEVGRISKGLNLPFTWGFNDWINEFKNNSPKYAINAFTTKQNIDIPEEFRKRGIVSGHAYMVNFKDDKAILRNPWYSQDTIITIQEFQDIFDFIDYSIVSA